MLKGRRARRDGRVGRALTNITSAQNCEGVDLFMTPHAWATSHPPRPACDYLRARLDALTWRKACTTYQLPVRLLRSGSQGDCGGQRGKIETWTAAQRKGTTPPWYPAGGSI